MPALGDGVMRAFGFGGGRSLWLAAVLALSFGGAAPSAWATPNGPVISDFGSNANGSPVSAGVSITFSGFVTDNVDPNGSLVEWDFNNDGVIDATSTVGGDVVSIAHTFAAKGTYTVVVKVTDGSNNTGTAQVIIDVRNSAIAFASTPNTNAVGGQPFTMTATVTSADGTPGTPTGNVTFTNIDGEFSGAGGPFVLGVVALDGSGVATLSHSLHPRMGTQRVTVSYAGGGTFDPIATPSGTAHTFVVGATSKGGTTTAIAANSSPSQVGVSTSFTVTVAGVSPSTDTPTGNVSVDFGDGGPPVSGVTLSGGTATVSHIYANVGGYSASASYGSSLDYNGSSTTSSASQIVIKGDQSITFNSSAPANATVGGTHYTVVATASPSGFAATFTSGSANCVVNGTEVNFTSAGGNCVVHADQAGDANYNAAPRVDQSFAVGKGATTASVQDPSPAVVGQQVTLVATVTAGDSLAPTGSVTFKDNGNAIGSAATLNGGTATINTSSLTVGTHTITAVYGGDGNFNGTTSAGKTQTIAKGQTTLGVTAAPAAAKAGRVVNIRAILAVTAPAAGTPAGSVTFKDGTRSLGSAPLASGHAAISTTALAIGSHTITASYPGSTDFLQSASSAGVTVSALTGAQTRVNSHTGGDQQLPAIAALTSGYVVVWASNAQDGSLFGVYGQRYNANGAKEGAEFPVNTTTAKDQTQPRVAGLSDGGFVVAWQSNGQDKSGLGVYGQRFSAAGAKAGAEFRVNTTTADDQALPAVAAFPVGGFVVAWQSRGQDGAGLGIFAQRYDANGKNAGKEFQVNTTTAKDQSAPAVAALSNGSFVIAWQTAAQDGSGLGIYAQRYNAAGHAVGTEFPVNTTTAHDQTLPVAAALYDGGFVIAWQSQLTDHSGLGVYAQRFTAAAGKVGGEFRVNNTVAGDQGQPAIAGFSDGGFVVTWMSDQQDGSGKGVYGQVFDGGGVKANAEFLVNTTTAKDQWQPAVAGFAEGNFAVAWTSQNASASQTDIFAQRMQVEFPH